MCNWTRSVCFLTGCFFAALAVVDGELAEPITAWVDSELTAMSAFHSTSTSTRLESPTRQAIEAHAPATRHPIIVNGKTTPKTDWERVGTERVRAHAHARSRINFTARQDRGGNRSRRKSMIWIGSTNYSSATCSILPALAVLRLLRLLLVDRGVLLRMLLPLLSQLQLPPLQLLSCYY